MTAAQTTATNSSYPVPSLSSAAGGGGGGVEAGATVIGGNINSNNPAFSTAPSASSSETNTNYSTTNQNTNNQTTEQNDTRLSRTTACLPIVYGSVAFYLGKKADEFQTHQWTLYLRGPNEEDLSVVISKVIFQLHASFAQPVRELTQPPFEVTERGWGEFEAQIRIHWKDPNEKPTVLNHGIKLYPPGMAPNALATMEDNAEPVIAETFDEVVFTDPDENFYRQLMRISVAPKVQSSQQEYFTNRTYSDQEDFLTLLEAQKFLQEELTKVKERFEIVTNELQSVDEALLVAQQQHRESSMKKGKAAATAAQRKPRSLPAAPQANKKPKIASTPT